MKKEVWLFRTKEWIAENPNKGTMYKSELNENTDAIHTDNFVKSVREKIKKQNASTVAGIYSIHCNKSNTTYVGQSMNIGSRIRQHKYKLQVNDFKSQSITYEKMSNDIKKYGIESFIFSTIEVIENPNIYTLMKKETEFMHKLLFNGVNLYNSYVPFDSNNMIYCPKNIKEEVKEFIKNKLNVL